MRPDSVVKLIMIGEELGRHVVHTGDMLLCRCIDFFNTGDVLPSFDIYQTQIGDALQNC